MPASTYQEFLKVANAQLREYTAAEQTALAAKINEIQNILTLQGANPTLWDYPTGTTLANAQTGNANSSTFDIGRDALHKPLLIRFVTTVGATPTCTYAIQGDTNSGFSSPVALSYADYLSPTTVVSTTFVITAAATNLKLVIPRQNVRFVRVVFSANTNVTNTVDITPLG